MGTHLARYEIYLNQNAIDDWTSFPFLNLIHPGGSQWQFTFPGYSHCPLNPENVIISLLPIYSKITWGIGSGSFGEIQEEGLLLNSLEV